MRRTFTRAWYVPRFIPI